MRGAGHKRGFSFLKSKVNILDKAGQNVGWLKSKLFSLGGAFRVFDAAGKEVALVKGVRQRVVPDSKLVVVVAAVLVEEGEPRSWRWRRDRDQVSL